MFIFDAHVDTLSRLVDNRETLESAEGHVNLANLRDCKQGAQFFASFVSPKYYHGLAMHRTMEMIDAFWQMLETYPDDLAFAGAGKDILDIKRGGRHACLLAIEGGEALEGKLSSLRLFYRLGVRLVTLTWNHRNELASGQSEGVQGGGLSLFGQEVVREMNRLGMLIDVSHLNEPGFWDVLRLSESPILASHSNARGLCDHPRNLTDEQIRALADSGGVIGVNFYSSFLTSTGEATVEHVLDHIEYLIKVGGVECVALGSDFDGIDDTPKGLEHKGKTLILAEALQERGYPAGTIEKVMGKNLLRLCCEVLG
mgnify:CR=1 FL=1